ncbi:MAG: TolC family protein [Halioglobus sp.]|nr:TolC family protein [Halioglobus sp.]
MTCSPAKAALLAAVFLVLGACTVVGPDYEAPQPVPLPQAWETQAAAAQTAEIGAWWRQFGDDTLNALVERGARQNLSLEAAGLRIVQARAALGISDALRFPQLQQINSGAAALYRDRDWFQSANASLDMAWEMDIWGKYARGIEASQASLYASIASYRDVLVSLTAEIARNYINYRTAQERIDLARQNIAIQERVLAMTEVQFDAGNVSELDVQQAKTQLYATRSNLPGLFIVQQQALNALAVLLGTIPEALAPLLAPAEEREPADFRNAAGVTQRPELTLDAYQAESVIPSAPAPTAQLSAALLLRRPDIQVAEMRARAQSARIGIASAELYPQFFLGGSIGVSQTLPSGNRFDLGDAVTANIGPGLRWNIFQYDRIRNQVRIEDALFQASLTDYNQALLEAVREVTNALQGYRFNLARSEHDLDAVKASVRAFNISATQYNNGLVTYERLLSTVEKMTLREDLYAQTRGGIANQLVALYKALGGGWDAVDPGPVVKPETERQMRERTDWGDSLDEDTNAAGASRD